MYPLGSNRQIGALGKTPGGVAAYLTPAQFGNQTAEWDASRWAESFYTDAGTTLATAEDQLIYRLGDVSGSGRYLDRFSGDGYRGQLKLNVQNGLPGLLNQSGQDLAYVSAAVFSAFFAAGAKCAFIVVKNFTSNTDSATVYQNDPLLVNQGGFWGATVRSSGSIRHYNYGSGEATGTETLANNVAAVITTWHTGGTIYLQKNLGTVYSTASGNTGGPTNFLGLFGSYGAYHAKGYFLRASTHNAYTGDSQRVSVISGLMQRYGIT